MGLYAGQSVQIWLLTWDTSCTLHSRPRAWSSLPGSLISSGHRNRHAPATCRACITGQGRHLITWSSILVGFHVACCFLPPRAERMLNTVPSNELLLQATMAKAISGTGLPKWGKWPFSRTELSSEEVQDLEPVPSSPTSGWRAETSSKEAMFTSYWPWKVWRWAQCHLSYFCHCCSHGWCTVFLQVLLLGILTRDVGGNGPGWNFFLFGMNH